MSLPARRPQRSAVALLVLAGLALHPASAAAAPGISGGNRDVWNAAEVPASYVITGTEEGAILVWRLQTSRGAAVPGVDPGGGQSPLTVTLDGIPDGAYRLVASQAFPSDQGQTARSFSVDTTPPGVTIRRPVAGAVYERGERVVADYSCQGAATCEGTVADGAPIDTSSTGPGALAVTAADAAGNEVVERVEFRVAAAPSPAPPPAGTPAGTPPPPSPPIRLAPAPPGEPEPEDQEPRTRNARLLRPPAAGAITTRRPLLRWKEVRRAYLYNLQIYRMRGGRATKVLSDFPTRSRYRVPRGRLAWGERYAWRIWPLVGGAYPRKPHGLSWFDVRRPVRLSPAQLLVNQRIAQAALRRAEAISERLDAGLVTGDLRDGGLGREDFSADVGLWGGGAAIANGLASPRPVVAPPARRSRAVRLRVSARQLLVNQRISQAAVRRANALARRLEGGLTGGDLREGAVTATKLAPGLRVSSARPAGPAPAASSTIPRAAIRRGGARVTLSARQVLVNQRISQAAVRRANATMALIEHGLTGAHFRDGAISAVSIAPALR